MLEPSLQSHGPDQSVPLRRPTGGAEALPDLLLIERARAGDERAVEALIRRYSRRLFRVARSVLVDDEHAEAAVVEAYLAAFSDLNRYEPTGKFAAWLTRLAFSQARALRASMRTGSTGHGLQTQSAADPTEVERHELEQAIARLPEVFRTVFVLRVLEGISGIETAACLGLHETTVRTRLFLAHRRLTPEARQRLRASPAALEVRAERIEHIVSRALAQLPHGSMLRICASAP